MKLFAPLSVVDTNEYFPNPIISPISTKVNKNFVGVRFKNEEDRNNFNDHFLFNKDSQLVWTNQLVIKNKLK